MVTGHNSSWVIPFGNPRIKACLTAPRGLSQPTTSFIGLLRLGIHRTPFTRFNWKLPFLFNFKCTTSNILVFYCINIGPTPTVTKMRTFCTIQESKISLLFLLSWWTWGESNSWPFHCKWNVLANWTTGPLWWAYQVSNLGPQSYQDCALANWAIRPKGSCPNINKKSFSLKSWKVAGR